MSWQRSRVFFEIPGRIKEKMFIIISLLIFHFSNPKPLQEVIVFQSIPTVIKKRLYFKPHFTSVEVWQYEEFTACPIRVLGILFLQACRNEVSTALLVSICAGQRSTQPDWASKDSLGNLVFGTGFFALDLKLSPGQASFSLREIWGVCLLYIAYYFINALAWDAEEFLNLLSLLTVQLDYESPYGLGGWTTSTAGSSERFLGGPQKESSFSGGFVVRACTVWSWQDGKGDDAV